MAEQVPCSRCGKTFADSYPSCPWCGLRRAGRTAELAPARAAAPQPPRAPAPDAASEQPPSPAPNAASAPPPAISISITSRDIGAAAARSARWALRHPRTSAGGIVALVLGWWLLLYLPASPSWALWDFYDAVEARNADAAASFIDFQSVTKNMMDKGFKTAGAKRAPGGMDPGQRMMKEALARGIGNLLTGPIAETMKAEFERKVSQGDPQTRITRWELLAAIIKLDRHGDSAETSGTDDKGQKYQITFSSKPDGHWKVVEVDGDAIQKGIEEGLRKSQRQMDGPPGADL